MTRAPHWWSWLEIVQHADRLGIPNFQRGAVWERSNRVALLESLFEESPCGSFVLWEPRDPGEDRLRHGVPLRRQDPSKPPMWLVDGQQRSRAMLSIYEELLAGEDAVSGPWLVPQADRDALAEHAVGLHMGREDADGALGPATTEEAADAPEEELDLPRIWFVVLPTRPELVDAQGESLFGKHSESRNVQRGSLFRFLTPRANKTQTKDGKNRGVPPLPIASIPLAALLTDQSVFADETRRQRVRSLVEAVLAGAVSPDQLGKLQEQVPWGPQFVTGFAFKREGNEGTLAHLTWEDLRSWSDRTRRDEGLGMLAAVLADGFADVFARFRKMLAGPRFAVGWLPQSDVSAAIDAYVRINRSGIRVQKEERALALLARARPALLDDLAAFARARDGTAHTDLRDRQAQRALLVHASDKKMGFGAWITLVTRFAALAVTGRHASRWIGVDAIDKKTFPDYLDRLGGRETSGGERSRARAFASAGEVVAEVAERASAALLLVDRVLTEQLHLDHRMARPHPRAVWPVLSLFYRVPADHIARLTGRADFREALGAVLHWLLMVPYLNKAEMEVLEERLFPQKVVEECLRVWPGDEVDRGVRDDLSTLVEGLSQTWMAKAARELGEGSAALRALRAMSTPGRLRELAQRQFRSLTAEAQTLQHAAVGWLYAIEKRGGRAAEFCWVAQEEAYQADPLRHSGVPKVSPLRHAEPLRAARSKDEASLAPEKQHIVPFSVGRKLLESTGTRATASPINSVGNLTWLSHRQNFWDALGDRWAAMDVDRDRDNLEARGMLAVVGDGDDRSALDIYEQLRALAMEDESPDARVPPLFAAFTRARVRWMNDQMAVWIDSYEALWDGPWLVSASEDGRSGRS